MWTFCREKAHMDGSTLYAIAQPLSTSYTCMRGTQFTWRGMGVGEARPALLTGPPGRRGGRRPPARRAA